MNIELSEHMEAASDSYQLSGRVRSQLVEMFGLSEEDRAVQVIGALAGLLEALRSNGISIDRGCELLRELQDTLPVSAEQN